MTDEFTEALDKLFRATDEVCWPLDFRKGGKWDKEKP